METIIIEQDLISKKIDDLFHLGFDQIRTAGGSSIDESHYAGTFIFKIINKIIYFLGVPYNSQFYKNHESNGHTKKRNEKPVETARREIYEETGLLVNEEDLEKIMQVSIPNRRDKAFTHTKYFYLTCKFTGSIPDFNDRPNPIDNETGTPLWIPYKKFKEVLYSGHQAAFLVAVNELRKQSVEYYYALA